MAWFRTEKGDAVGYPDLIALMTGSTPFKLSDTKTQATRIPQHMFYGSYYLEAVDVPQITRIDAYAFCDCNNLEYINLPELQILSDHGFSCKRAGDLRSTININCPKLSSIGQYGFYDYAAQDPTKTLEFPRVSNIGKYAFASSSSNYKWQLAALVLSFSGGANISENAFSGAEIGTIDATGQIAFEDNALSGATVTNLILRNSYMSTLVVGGSLGTAPAHIYVNDDLLQDYLDDDDWSQYAAIIDSISNMPS